MRTKLGFTLVELMVVLAVFGVFFLVGTNILVKVLQDSGQTAAQNDLRQNANQILANLASSVKAASCVDWGVNTSGVAVNTYSDSCQTLVGQYQFTSPQDANFPGRVLKNGSAISTAKALAINCGAKFASCGSGLAGSSLWRRLDGSVPGSTALTACLTRVFASGSCQGSLLGFVSGGCSCTSGGLCFDLAGPVSGSGQSYDVCKASEMSGNDICSLYRPSCTNAGDPFSGIVYTKAYPLQWTSGAVSCVSGASLGFYDSLLGTSSLVVFDAAKYSGENPGYPNLTVNLTMQNNLNPTGANSPSQCASVVVKDTFTPRRSP